MKRVLIIGAGFLQDFVIRKAKEMGYYTLTVDADPNAVGFKNADKYEVINIVDEEACLQFAKKEKIDGVLTAATDYGVLSASYVAEQMGLPGLNYATARLIKNKYLVRKKLFEDHVDDTEQTYEVDENTNISELAHRLKYPVMIKPCDGSGSRGAGRVDRCEEIEAACECAIEASITHKAMIESFVEGKEYGAESFVVNGKVYVLGIMKKWMTAPPFYAELGHAVPSGLSIDIENKIRECVKKAICALSINHGSVNMDIIITDSGKVHIVDIGARMGGNLIGSHIIPLGTGIDYMKNMISAAVGDGIDFTPHNKKSVVTRLLALNPGIVTGLPDFEKIKDDYEVMIEQHLHIGDKITPYRTNLDGCGYVIACGDKVEQSIEKADKVKTLIDRMIERAL